MPQAEAATLTLDDLFDEIGTERLHYSARCGRLSGGWLQFDTLVSRSHDGSRWLAVDQPGACPDCAAVPVAALDLPGFEPPSGTDRGAPVATARPAVVWLRHRRRGQCLVPAPGAGRDRARARGGRAMMLVRGGLVLQPGGERFAPADLLIDGETIADVVAPGSVSGEGRQVVDAQDRLVIPGLVNGHNHAQANLGKGLADRWTLELLLNHAPWTGGRRTLEEKYLSAAIGACEMLRKGCTASYDMFAEFPLPTVEGVNAVAQAYADVGVRAVIAPMMADRSFFEAIPGLADALPDGLARAGAGDPLRAARAEPVGVSVDPGTVALRPTGVCGRRSGPPSRTTAATSSCAAAATSRANTAWACRCTWPSRRCRPWRHSSATASRSSRIWTIWACCSRAFASPTACGWTTTTARDWRTMAPRSRTTRAAT